LFIKVGSRLTDYKCEPSPPCCGLQKATFTLICRVSIFWCTLCSSSFSSIVSELSRQLDVVIVGSGVDLSQILGGKNSGHKYWGRGKNLGKIYFQTTFSKFFWKTSFYSQNFWWPFFSHRQLFQKMYTLHSKVTPFSLYFSFFVCFFCFLSCFF